MNSRFPKSKVGGMSAAILLALLLLGGTVHATEPATGNGKSKVQNKESSKRMNVEKSVFGKTAEGESVDLFTCVNANGLVLKLTNYGAIVVSLETPDRNGKLANINLGFDKLDGYLARHPYFGSTVGRFCNRIAKGKFTLDGKEYTLATNNGPNHLHGGIKGFDKAIWAAVPFASETGVGVRFTYTSKDGEEGYPGNLQTTATYTLTKDNELVVDLAATTDKPTVLNLTNHNYWNLSGAGSGTIRNHVMQILAESFLAVDDGLIPTGEFTPVAGTPLDFRKPETIGARIEQIKADPVGYDHCYALGGKVGELKLAARVYSPASGRVMEIRTTQPGIQFYSGNFLDGSEGNGGFKQHEGFCLETQHYPDSPNQEKFPTTVLRPGEKFRHTTVHKFSVE